MSTSSPSQPATSAASNDRRPVPVKLVLLGRKNRITAFMPRKTPP